MTDNTIKAGQQGAHMATAFDALRAELAAFQAREGRLLTQITELRRELAAKQAPEGWKLVPVEPTPEMRKAACDAWLDCGSKMFLNKAFAAAKAAIKAAPATQPAPVAVEISDERLIALRKATFQLPVGKPGVEYGRALRFARAVIAEMSKPAPVAQPMCRDCADFGPICPNSGKPCKQEPKP